MTTTVEISDETAAAIQAIQSQAVGEPSKKSIVHAAIEALQADINDGDEDDSEATDD